MGKRHTCIPQSFCYDLIETLDVGARGDLGHDTLELPVLLPLRTDDVRQQPPTRRPFAGNHGRRGFIAARLNAEHQNSFVLGGGFHAHAAS
jgi:hypothetical protein